MSTFKRILAGCVLVLGLAAHCGTHAAPIYHVSVDTRGQSGQALMDLTFLANAGAPSATAVLSHFSGAWGALFEASAGVGGVLPGTASLSNENGGSYLTHYVLLGGVFKFDIRFEGAFAVTEAADQTLFSATLYNAQLTGYAGAPGSFAEFILAPMVAGQYGGVRFASPNGQAAIVEAQAALVPAPSSLALMMAGLALLGWRIRPGRRSGGRAPQAHVSPTPGSSSAGTWRSRAPTRRR